MNFIKTATVLLLLIALPAFSSIPGFTDKQLKNRYTVSQIIEKTKDAQSAQSTTLQTIIGNYAQRAALLAGGGTLFYVGIQNIMHDLEYENSPNLRAIAAAATGLTLVYLGFTRGNALPRTTVTKTYLLKDYFDEADEQEESPANATVQKPETTSSANNPIVDAAQQATAGQQTPAPVPTA